MTLMRALLLICCSLAPSYAQSTVRTEPKAEAARATLADISWIAGQWQGKGLGGIAEETWSHPASGSMVGMFRIIRNDKVWFYELMVISEENRSLTLRLKHFHSDMKGWEEKDRTVDFKLVRVDDKGVWFDGLNMLRDGRDGMTAAVMVRDKDGKTSEVKLAYRRVAQLEPLR
jgi:hypothetical protein